jgi:uncharacterized protein YjbI with pentapeptide repeats
MRLAINESRSIDAKPTERTEMEANTEAKPRTQQILSRWSGAVLFECELPEGVESGMAMRHALEMATDAHANLSVANLRGADLRGADLSDANLSGADLSGADLSGANLSDANLRGADLSVANLRGANLSDANLRGANLRGANLSVANLRGADLRGADLSGADLSDANLSGADLSGADLSGANLSDANLSVIRADFFDVLLRAPREIAGLRAALIAGRVDGSTYEGECACLVGTIAHVRGGQYNALGNGLMPDSDRSIERWFMGINRGDTPETNQVSAKTVEWLDEFVGLLAIATAPEVQA